jgi:hypothetical protein
LRGSVGWIETGAEGVDFVMVNAEKILRGRKGDHAACAEERDALAEEKSFADVVRDEHDGFFETSREGAELALKFGASDGIEGAEGLVHKENRRIGSEGAGDTDALALAAGKFARVAGGKFGGIETYQAQ